MSFALQREIYGNTPWLVDSETLPALQALLENAKKGILPENKIKNNSPYIYDIKSQELRLINSQRDLRNNDDFTGVGIINLDGPITVNGGPSSFGVNQLSEIMLSMANDERVSSFLVLGNSGGGASAAVEIMSNTILELRQDGFIINGLVTKGGIMCSACFGIMSACTRIDAESEMSIVGSAGTMIQFSGREANTTDSNGIKHIRIYATQSTAKNQEFEEALNNDNFELLINDILDPINERFLSLIQDNRPNIDSSLLDGRTMFAKDAVGSFIDGISSFDEVLNQTMSQGKDDEEDRRRRRRRRNTSKNNNKSKITNNNKKSENMTKAELKQEYPSVYQSIFDDGVKQGKSTESDRVGSWMAHAKTDIDSVKAGIESGESISATQREEFFVKQNSIKEVKKIEKGNAAPIASNPPTEDPKTESEKEIESHYKDF